MEHSALLLISCFFAPKTLINWLRLLVGKISYWNLEYFLILEVLKPNPNHLIVNLPKMVTRPNWKPRKTGTKGIVQFYYFWHWKENRSKPCWIIIVYNRFHFLRPCLLFNWVSPSGRKAKNVIETALETCVETRGFLDTKIIYNRTKWVYGNYLQLLQWSQGIFVKGITIVV